MNTARIVGISLFVVGLILMAIGYNASDAPLDQISNTLTGHFTDRTVQYLVIGAAAAIGGGLLAIFGNRRS